MRQEFDTIFHCLYNMLLYPRDAGNTHLAKIDDDNPVFHLSLNHHILDDEVVKETHDVDKLLCLDIAIGDLLYVQHQDGFVIAVTSTEVHHALLKMLANAEFIVDNQLGSPPRDVLLHRFHGIFKVEVVCLQELYPNVVLPVRLQRARVLRQVLLEFSEFLLLLLIQLYASIEDQPDLPVFDFVL